MITRRQLLGTAGLVTIAAGASACSSGTVEEVRGTPPPEKLEVDQVPETEQAVTFSTLLGWNVMTHDDQAQTGNVVVSPSSLLVSLAALAEGATGASEESLDEAFTISSDRRSKAVGALRQSLSGYADMPSAFDTDEPPATPKIHLANRVVILDKADVRQEYLDRLATFYDTGVAQVARKRAEKELSTWVKEHTAGQVKKSGITIGRDTRVITQDALLFAASWQRPFESDRVELPFTPPDGTRHTVAGMRGTFTTAVVRGASETDGNPQWTAIRLPYDDRLAMDIVLPEEGFHPTDVFWALETIPWTLSEDEAGAVEVTMPSVDVTSAWELLGPLTAQGIDLTEMDGIFENATTGQMAQQVRLSVTARGTVGAASTEAELETKAPPQDLTGFTVNRPYIMVVRDTRTGWPLFMAIINDPGARAD